MQKAQRSLRVTMSQTRIPSMERPKQRLAEPELEMPKLRQMREKLASVPTVNNCSQLSLFERTFFTSKVALLRQCDSKARATWSRFKDLFKKDN